MISFEMKGVSKNSIGLIPIMILIFLSCQTERSGYNDIISNDLQEIVVDNPEISGSEGENTNPLIGEDDHSWKKILSEWEPIKFAYSANGENYEDISVIPNNIAKPFNEMAKRITVYEGNAGFTVNELTTITCRFSTEYYFYSISNNLIKLTDFRNPLYVDIHYTDEAFDIMCALRNVYSFVIKGNELFVYFTGLKDKNILIFKKYEL